METMYMVQIPPVACPRPRVTNRGFVYYPAGYNKFRASLAIELKKLNIPRFEAKYPLVLRARFFMPTPKKGVFIGYHYKKPDLDNLTKSLCDGLETAGIVPNDSQFCVLDCAKQYSKNPKIMFQIDYAEFEEEQRKETLQSQIVEPQTKHDDQ